MSVEVLLRMDNVQATICVPLFLPNGKVSFYDSRKIPPENHQGTIAMCVPINIAEIKLVRGMKGLRNAGEKTLSCINVMALQTLDWIMTGPSLTRKESFYTWRFVKGWLLIQLLEGLQDPYNILNIFARFPVGKNNRVVPLGYFTLHFNLIMASKLLL